MLHLGSIHEKKKKADGSNRQISPSSLPKGLSLNQDHAMLGAKSVPRCVAIDHGHITAS